MVKELSQYVFVIAKVVITRFIISMTKLLDAVWLRGVHLFH